MADTNQKMALSVDEAARRADTCRDKIYGAINAGKLRARKNGRRTLNSDGTKRERKMLGRQGVLRLSPDEAITCGLGITEGVEDGLAVLLSGWSPVWAATSAGAIARLPVVAGIESITVFADADEAGLKAAEGCCIHWRKAGREACIAAPVGVQ